MSLPIVTHLDHPPEVGHYYRVPVVRAYHNHRLDDWPVIGPAHEDAALLNFPFRHLHLDLRFLRAPQRRHLDDPRGWEYPAYGSPIQELATSSYGNNDNTPLPKPKLTKRLCAIDWPADPFRVAEWFRSLEDHYVGERLRPGLICPHRGVCLKSMPVRPDGTVICPTHGLQWNAETGELVRRDALPAYRSLKETGDG